MLTENLFRRPPNFDFLLLILPNLSSEYLNTTQRFVYNHIIYAVNRFAVIIYIYISLSLQLPFVQLKEGKYILRETHNYFYQVQSQLRMTKRARCLFFVYTKGWSRELEIISPNNEWWMKELEPNLTK